MTTQTKTAKDPSAEGAPNKQELPDVSAVTALVQKNVERLADLQKATLDALGHQNADVTESLRKSLKSTPASPVVTFLDFAEKGLDGWITAQKNIVDLIVQQSAHSLQATEERTGFATQSIGKLNELVQQTVDRTAAAQKAMLEFAAKQNEAVAKAFQRPGAGAVGEVAQSMERGVATIINAQKEFLDTASKFAKDAAAKV